MDTPRLANENDLKGILNLYTMLHNNPVPEVTHSLTNLWKDIMKDSNYNIIVIEDDKEIISSCTLIIIPNLTHAQRPYALIENVITIDRYRRQGLASKCLAYARNLAKESNCYKIMLLTGSKDEHVLSFYKKAGYNSNDKTAFISWL